MNIQQIPDASLLDILFDGRNKEYGAYQLRKQYNRRLSKAIAVMLTTCLVLITSYLIAGKLHGSKRIIPPSLTDVSLTNAVSTPKKEIPIVIPKTAPHVSPPPTIRIVTPRIVPDAQATDAPPPNADIPDNVRISNVTSSGDGDAAIQGPVSNGAGSAPGVVEAPVARQDDEDKIFNKVEIESSYNGGPAAWQRFLIKNFRVPEDASGELSGKTTVMVRFIVDKEGNVSSVEAIDGPDILRKEAVRVIKLSGKWIPAIQNGRKVNSYKQQPISVEIQEP